MKPIAITPEIAVGEQPDDSLVQQLSNEGYQTVVNLQGPDEEGEGLSSREEGLKVQSHGMTYMNVPIPRSGITEHHVDDFRAKMGLMPKPVYVHCSSGDRAAALAMIDTALENGWTGEETLRRAGELHVECENPNVREFLVQYVDSHRG